MYYIARSYLQLSRLIKRVFGISLCGAGYLLRRVKSDRILNIDGLFLYFDHRLAASYAHPVVGNWTEPETIEFIKFIKSKMGALTFINVGANTGEMCVVAGAGQSTKIFALDPIAECCDATRKSLELNGIESFEIYNCLVGEKESEINFAYNLSFSGTSSILEASENSEVQLTKMVKLDSIITSSPANNNKILMLIDVEGYELNVLRGSKNLISSNPIIIFEYNNISKKHFSVNDIKSFLGPRYEVYRLNKDAKLDAMVDDAWNCVAVPVDHSQIDLISSLIIKK